jgi:hypothetical protein
MGGKKKEFKSGWIWWYMPVLPATWEVEMGKISEVSPGIKLVRPHLNKPNVVECICDPSYAGDCR